jgi:hypothetical protein
MVEYPEVYLESEDEEDMFIMERGYPSGNLSGGDDDDSEDYGGDWEEEEEQTW